MPAEIILSIDPALRCTGYAVLVRQGKAVRAATYGLIRNPPKIRPSGCLLAIRDSLGEIIRQYQPSAMAVEGVIFVQSYQTAITLGAARGAAILAATEKGLAVHEYSPKSVKQAVVGRGAADKQQVAFMVRALLGLTETPSPDAADAIAVGIAHFHAVDTARLRKDSLPVI